MRGATAVSSILALLTTFVAASAHAQYGAPDYSSKLYPEHYGRPAYFEAIIRTGIADSGAGSPVVLQPGALGPVTEPGAIYTGNAQPYTSSFVLDESIGWRFRPIRRLQGVLSLSAGFDLGMRYGSGASGTDGTSDVGRLGFHIGTYLRAYVRVAPKLEWWVGTGFGYMLDRQKYNRLAIIGGAERSSSFQLTHHGIGIPLRGGVMVQLDRSFWLGPSFEYSYVAPTGGCAKLSGALTGEHDLCTGSRTVVANGYDVWSLGFDMRFGI